MDGTVCNGCGDCCSRLCAPYGPYAVKVCQPANGCHVDGDLCTKTEDCCGAAGTGLPGAGNVVCEIQPGLTVGVCRNPTGLNPECDICHYKNYACSISSARNDCASAPGNTGVCKLDALGVPRCFGGGACASSGAACACDFDCCDGGHCVPGANGGLVCQAGCSNTAGACTIDADCCSGLHCYVQLGSTTGSCGGPPPPPAGVDAGCVGSPEVCQDAAPTCSAYGQSCTQDADCCNGVACNAPGGTAPCAPGATGCTCFSAIQ
jgi:hypothetical protein